MTNSATAAAGFGLRSPDDWYREPTLHSLMSRTGDLMVIRSKFTPAGGFDPGQDHSRVRAMIYALARVKLREDLYRSFEELDRSMATNNCVPSSLPLSSLRQILPTIPIRRPCNLNPR